MGFRIITETPRGGTVLEIVTEIPVAIDAQGGPAIDAYVAADVARQLSLLEPSEVLDGADLEE
jgi:hypothetical protein